MRKRYMCVSSLDILRTIACTTAQSTINDAIKTGDLNLVRLIIESGEVVGDDAFIYACECTEIAHLLLALERGVNPAARDNIALRYACENGHTEFVRLLLDLPLERGVNPAVRNNAALRCACQQGANGNRSFAPRATA